MVASSTFVERLSIDSTGRTPRAHHQERLRPRRLVRPRQLAGHERPDGSGKGTSAFVASALTCPRAAPPDVLLHNADAP
jgi:hypothetical protein